MRSRVTQPTAADLMGRWADCPGRHGLVELAAPAEGWTCARCTAAVGAGWPLRGCLSCRPNYAICERCSRVGGGDVVGHPPQGALLRNRVPRAAGIAEGAPVGGRARPNQPATSLQALLQKLTAAEGAAVTLDALLRFDRDRLDRVIREHAGVRLAPRVRAQVEQARVGWCKFCRQPMPLDGSRGPCPVRPPSPSPQDPLRLAA